MGMDQYLLIPFLGGWTSINPSHFDVNYRGTIGFDTLPYHDSRQCVFFHHSLNHCWYLKIQWFGSYDFPMSKTDFLGIWPIFRHKNKRSTKHFIIWVSQTWSWTMSKISSKICSWNIDLKQGWHQSLIDSGGRACGFQMISGPSRSIPCSIILWIYTDWWFGTWILWLSIHWE